MEAMEEVGVAQEMMGVGEEETVAAVATEEAEEGEEETAVAEAAGVGVEVEVETEVVGVGDVEGTSMCHWSCSEVINGAFESENLIVPTRRHSFVKR